MTAVREVRIGQARLILGDCRSVIVPRKPDAVVTDIPYECSQESNGLRELDYGDWDSAGASRDAMQMLRALCGIPSIVAFCNWTQLNDIQRLFPERMWRPLIWDKTNPTVINGQFLFLPSVEFAYFGKQDGAWFGGNCIPALWRGSAPTDREHPNQKPLALMEWVVTNTVAPGAICLDPFMGSGTTGVACVRLGRQFIGIERDPSHFETAVRRITEAHRQADLFHGDHAPAPARATQPDMLAAISGDAA